MDALGVDGRDALRSRRRSSRRSESTREEPPRGQPRRHQIRDGPVPGPLRRLPRHGRPWRPWARHHAGLGVGPDRRWPVQDHQGRRAEHRDAGQPAHERPRDVAGPRLPAHAGHPRAGRAAARQRPERRTDLSHDLRRVSPGEWRRRTHWTRLVPRRRRRGRARRLCSGFDAASKSSARDSNLSR